MTRVGVRMHLTRRNGRCWGSSRATRVPRDPADALKEIWDTEDVADSGYVRIYISKLRMKLGSDPEHPTHLLTQQGWGYRLIMEP